MSSTNVGSIHYDLGLDTSKFDKAMSGVSGKLKSVGSAMTNAGKTMTVGVTLPIVAGAALAIKAASDLNETMNKVDVAFKDQAGTVKKWGETTLKSIGLAKGTALDAAALFGDMSTSMGLNTKEAAQMSMKLTQLGADMASFKNISFERAQVALAGVYTGETEALKGLGIVMTETNLEAFAQSRGIKENIQDMTQAEKVQLRYAYVMSVTKNAQGDFSRTFNGTANQIRYTQERVKELTAEFGEKLLPITGRILELFNKLLTAFSNLTPKQQDMIIKVLALAAAIGPVLIILGQLTKALSVLAAHPIILVIAAMVAALAFLQMRFQLLTKAVDWLSKNVMPILVTVGRQVWSIMQQIGQVFMTWVMPSLRALGNTIKTNLLPALKTLWDSIVRLYHSMQPALTTVLKVVGAIMIGSLIAALWLTINALNAFIKALTFVIRAISITIGWISNIIKWFGNAGSAIARAVSSAIGWIGRLPSSVASAARGVGSALSSIKSIAQNTLSNAGQWLYQAGRNILQGLINGVKSLAGSVAQTIKDTVSNAVSGVKNFLGIHSPSTLFAEMGKNMAQGMVQGLQAGAPSVALATAGLGNAAASSMNIYGNVNIGDRPTADYFFRDYDRKGELASMGLAG